MSAIPDATIAAIRRYVDHGIPPGGFLLAVLGNDLCEACARADDGNARALAAIVAYLYNETPAGCWGSPERVADWLTAKSQERASTVRP